jgi:hypothetical protein
MKSRRERLNDGTPAVDISLIMSTALLAIAGIGLLGFLLGWLLPVRAIWIIVPVAVLAFGFIVMGAGTDAPDLYMLFSFEVIAGWGIVVLAGRGLRRLMRG